MRFNELQVAEGVNDPHIFKAVFMAGAPGSGKSTVANKLLSHTGLKSLNFDNFWHLYHKLEKPQNFEKHAQLYKAQEKNYIEGRLGLLIDGTARNPRNTLVTKQALEKIGYETTMIFVNTTLDTSLERADQRSIRIGRKVDPDFIKNAWDQVQQGLGQLQNIFGANFYIVDNNGDGNLRLDYVSRSLDRFLNSPPKMPAAKEWIAAQQKSRSQAVATFTEL